MIPEKQTALIQLILINLIPMVGLLLFDWKLFEIAVTYILESSAMFFVFIFDHGFVQKSTRLYLHRAIVQQVFMFGFFAFFMFGYILVLYAICGSMQAGRLENTLFPQLAAMKIWYILIFFIVIEFYVYYSKIKKSLGHPQDNFWRVMKRFAYLHVLVVTSVIIFATFFADLKIIYVCFIGTALTLEVYQILRPAKKFKNFATRK